jgi:hypothetical protein
MKNKINEIVKRILEVIYFPIYVIFWLLHKIARFILAISYFGMLEGRIAKDIINSLFRIHGKY